MGAYKARSPLWRTLLMGAVAGCYTAMFSGLMLAVGPNCGGLAAQNPGLAKYLTGAIGLPFQLLIIVVRLTGAAGCVAHCVGGWGRWTDGWLGLVKASWRQQEFGVGVLERCLKKAGSGLAGQAGWRACRASA